MTKHLSFWIGVAAVVPVVAAGMLVGVSPAALLGLGLTPTLLGALLLARALVLRLRGTDPGLRIGGRTVLGGRLGLFVPTLLLIACLGLREAGIVTVQLNATNRSHQMTTTLEGWNDGAPPGVVADEGLAVHAPAGAFGDAFARELRCVWSTADGRLHADVTLTGDPPRAWLPLYKDEQVKFRVEAPMQWHRADGAIRWSKLKVDFTATYRMIGTGRSRDFQEWIGRELGEAVRKQVDEAVTNANRKS